MRFDSVLSEFFYSPDFMASILRNCKAVITIYDLIWHHLPDHFPRGFRSYHLWTRLSAMDADTVIAVSRNTTNDIIRFYKVSQDRIKVIYGAPEEMFRPIDDEKRIQLFLKRYRLPHQFIYFNSSIEPRKNHINLLKAYQRLKMKGIGHKLVFSGLYLYSVERA